MSESCSVVLMLLSWEVFFGMQLNQAQFVNIITAVRNHNLNVYVTCLTACELTFKFSLFHTSHFSRTVLFPALNFLLLPTSVLHFHLKMQVASGAKDNTSILGWLGISLPFHLPTNGMTACRHIASPHQTFHTAWAAHRVTNLAFPEPCGVWLMYLLYQKLCASYFIATVLTGAFSILTWQWLCV